MINLDQYKKITILTGAGCSTDLGLPTFETLYADKEVMATMTAEVFKTNPEKVWKVLGARRPAVFDIHRTGKIYKSFYQYLYSFHLQDLPAEVRIVTTNTDGAQVEIQGGSGTIQYHGDIRHTLCSNNQCDFRINFDENTYQDAAPVCPHCGAPLRPNVTLYGEIIRSKEDYESKRAMRDCDLLIVMGTSGRSGTVDRFMRAARFENSKTVLVNKTRIDGLTFDHEYIGDVREMVEKNFLPALRAVE